MNQLSNIEQRLSKIEARNARVELDKRWETSWTRRLAIAALTFMVTLVLLSLTGVDRPFMNTVVALTGYILSTLAINSIRTRWQRTYKGRRL